MRHGRIACLLGSVLLAALVQPACGKEAYIQEADTQKPDGSTAAPGPLGDRLKIDESVSLTGLAGPADVVRDEYGIAHIYASSAEDALRVEGYVMARDRGLQMELLRRIASGRMAEILAAADASHIDNDILMRTIGLHRAALAQYEAMDPAGEPRRLLEAFADGVSQLNASLQSGKVALPIVWLGASAEWFTPWTPQDSLAVLKLHNLASGLRVDEEIDLTLLMSSLRDTWTPDAEEAAVARRAHVAPDLLRFAPIARVSAFDALPKPGTAAPPEGSSRSEPPVNVELLKSLAPTMTALRAALDAVGHGTSRAGNAFAVSSGRTSSGASILAADLHRPLAVPAELWFVHLEASGKAPLHVAGAALPGVPGVLLGFNDKVAWAPSESMNDEADSYAEVLSDDASSVRFNGAEVALGHVAETIAVQAAASVALDVRVVPHHGPVLPAIDAHGALAPDPALGALSLRWSGLDAGGELEAMVGLLRAADIDAAQAALATWQSGAQTFVLADAKGAVAATSQSVPLRPRRAFLWDAASLSGALPCMVLSGSGEAEWAGILGRDAMPSMVRPSRGWVAAANADPSGVTFDNDPSNDRLSDGTPIYLGCMYDAGLRQARIAERLGALAAAGPEQLAEIQSDVRSALGARLAKYLRTAMTHALSEQATPGSFPALSALASSDRFAGANVAELAAMLDGWEALGFQAGAGVKVGDGTPSDYGEDQRASQATVLLNAWLVRMLQGTLGDEAARMGLEKGLPGDMGMRALVHLLESDPKTLASYDKEAGDSILFDDMTTEVVEGRDERMVAALLDAVDWMNATMGTARDDDWRWGLVHTLRMEPIVAGLGIEAFPADGDKAFPEGFPRQGDLFSLDSSSYDFRVSNGELSFRNHTGPSVRLVVEMGAQGPKAKMSIAGELSVGMSSGECGKEVKYCGEDVKYWGSRRHGVPFTLDSVVGAGKWRMAVGAK
jgi:penicillin G amidase